MGLGSFCEVHYWVLSFLPSGLDFPFYFPDSSFRFCWQAKLWVLVILSRYSFCLSNTHTHTYTFLIYFASALTLPSHSMQYWVPLLSFDFYYFFFFILLSNSETLVLRRLQTKDLQPTSFSFCVRRNLPDGPGNTFPTVLQLGKLLNSALLWGGRITQFSIPH